ncbi:hypothetical protein DFH09DRAFT_1104665 [Mycena vulgaris]|nr:hypothetical protein DFH09DRAFT_1104665 [Mycena vulgaris]
MDYIQELYAESTDGSTTEEDEMGDEDSTEAQIRAADNIDFPMAELLAKYDTALGSGEPWRMSEEVSSGSEEEMMREEASSRRSGGGGKRRRRGGSASEDHGRRVKRRRTKKKVNGPCLFLDVEAGEADGSEEEEEEEGEGWAAGFLDDVSREESSSAPAPRGTLGREAEDQEREAEELVARAREYEARARQERRQLPIGGEGVEDEAARKAAAKAHAFEVLARKERGRATAWAAPHFVGAPVISGTPSAVEQHIAGLQGGRQLLGEYQWCRLRRGFRADVQVGQLGLTNSGGILVVVRAGAKVTPVGEGEKALELETQGTTKRDICAWDGPKKEQGRGKLYVAEPHVQGEVPLLPPPPPPAWKFTRLMMRPGVVRDDVVVPGAVPTLEEIALWSTTVAETFLRKVPSPLPGTALVAGTRVVVVGGEHRGKTGFIAQVINSVGRLLVSRCGTTIVQSDPQLYETLAKPTGEGDDAEFVSLAGMRRQILGFPSRLALFDRVLVKGDEAFGWEGGRGSWIASDGVDPHVGFVTPDGRKLDVPMSHLRRDFQVGDLVKVVLGAFVGDIGILGARDRLGPGFKMYSVSVGAARAREGKQAAQENAPDADEAHPGYEMVGVLPDQIDFAEEDVDGNTEWVQARAVVGPDNRQGETLARRISDQDRHRKEQKAMGGPLFVGMPVVIVGRHKMKGRWGVIVGEREMLESASERRKREENAADEERQRGVEELELLKRMAEGRRNKEERVEEGEDKEKKEEDKEKTGEAGEEDGARGLEFTVREEAGLRTWIVAEHHLRHRESGLSLRFYQGVPFKWQWWRSSTALGPPPGTPPHPGIQDGGTEWIPDAEECAPRPPAAALPEIGLDDGGVWLCIPRLKGKRVDVRVLKKTSGRVTGFQAGAAGQSGYIEIEEALTEAQLNNPITVRVGEAAKRIRLEPRWLAPMRRTLCPPLTLVDGSIAHSRGRVVIIGPSNTGGRDRMGDYGETIPERPESAGELVWVRFPRGEGQSDPNGGMACFPVGSLCRAYNQDGVLTKATRFIF